MRGKFDLGITPAKFDIWVVTFAFRDFANAVYKRECLRKVFEFEFSGDRLHVFGKLPARNLRQILLGLGFGERVLVPFTGNTFFGSKIRHKYWIRSLRLPAG